MRTIGKYEILEELGRGGFAVVYKARDTALDFIVALKVLHPHWVTDPQFARRFHQEARAAADLRHPNIVTVYEAGEVDGQLYIAMAYLPGRTLHDLLKEKGVLSLEAALTILEQLASALDYAHGQGVIHRDIRPTNVMVEDTAQQPRVTLMDFGLVKAMEGGSVLTASGTLLGSPEYMAPEQADVDRLHEIGPATDRYALGVVAYQMLTGRVPFPGNTPATLHAHLYTPPPDPRRFVTGLPVKAINVLLTMLAKAPIDRFPTASAFITLLREAQDAERQRQAREAHLASQYAMLQAAVHREAWENAIQIGQRIQQTAPNYADVSRLVSLAWEKGQKAKAAQAATQARPQQEAQLRPLYAQLQAAITQHDWAKVLRIGGQIQALKPDDPIAAQWITHALMQLRRSAPQAPAVKPPRPVHDSLPSWFKPVGIGLVTVILSGIMIVTLGPLLWGMLNVSPTLTPTKTPEPTPMPTKTPKPTPVLSLPNCETAGATWTRPTDGMTLVCVPSGTFQMGSEAGGSGEKPVHSVTLSAFWIDQTEVTNWQYAKCVSDNVCIAATYSIEFQLDERGQPDWDTQFDFGNDFLPVAGVDWYNAASYCNWAGGQLPTEAQWEYAARGPEEYIYPWGNTFDETKANFCDKSCPYDWADKSLNDGYKYTAWAGRFSESKSWVGAYNMAGNVWEWILDWYEGGYPSESQINPQGPDKGEAKVVRGGSWWSPALMLRSTLRFSNPPTSYDNYGGFRCVVMRAQE